MVSVGFYFGVAAEQVTVVKGRPDGYPGGAGRGPWAVLQPSPATVLNELQPGVEFDPWTSSA
ncbi:hypothetical protein GCM10009593_26820 [Microlunatus antarcticus]